LKTAWFVWKSTDREQSGKGDNIKKAG